MSNLSGSKKWYSRWSLKFYLRIYLAMLASLVVAAIIIGVMLQMLMNGSEHFKKSMADFSLIATDILPPVGASKERQLAALQRWKNLMEVDFAVYAADGSLISSTKAGAALYLPPNVKDGWFTGLPDPIAVKLPDQRWILMVMGPRVYVPSFGQILVALLVALAVALGSYPIIRRLTVRLERLQASVDALGEGQLSTRVPVEGNDEVARLAMSFNQSAARIEALVAAQKSLLANASHELRSPLTRIRMAVELMQEQAQPAIRAELAKNINELDQLIDEILLSSRLEATAETSRDDEELDLTGLLAEECARVHAELTVQMDSQLNTATPVFRGDPKLLRRLLRNLLENARRYGEDKPIEASLRIAAQRLEIDICDRGPGVPPEQRERIFEPFYRLPGASESNGGVGLGLSLVGQIAQLHGGQVQCQGREGGGSCFRVSFPLG